MDNNILKILKKVESKKYSVEEAILQINNYKLVQIKKDKPKNASKIKIKIKYTDEGKTKHINIPAMRFSFITSILKFIFKLSYKSNNKKNKTNNEIIKTNSDNNFIVIDKNTDKKQEDNIKDNSNKNKTGINYKINDIKDIKTICNIIKGLKYLPSFELVNIQSDDTTVLIYTL